MLLTLGVGSAVSLTGCVVTIICDDFPHWKRWLVVTGICLIGFLSGLVYVTPVRQLDQKNPVDFTLNFLTLGWLDHLGYRRLLRWRFHHFPDGHRRNYWHLLDLRSQPIRA